MADNLLDKASILLTPTAYNDGRMLSVKPNENLYGSELVTNGDFGTDSDWTKGTGWSIGEDKASRTAQSGSTSMYQSVSFTANKSYKITYDLDISAGSFLLRIGGGALIDTTPRTTSGTYTEYIVANSGNNVLNLRAVDGNFIGSIDNVSVVEDLSGDFTFSRSSAATRVNAQGLVENVQIISSELVSNGNFSQIGTEEVSNGNFSQEGSELITNGDFATDSNWTISGSSISISGGKLNFVNATSNSEFAQQSIVAPIGKTYKITLDVSNLGSGESIKIRYPFQDFTINTNGTHILYGVGNTANVFRLTPNSSTASFSIDNVSVKEVGQDWALGTGWSIGDDKAVFDDTTTNRISQTGLSITSGKSYKINFTIADCPTTAHMTIYDGGGSDLIVPNENYVNGSYTRYYTATTNETGVSFWGNTAGDTFTITNISVKEVGQDWILGSGWSIGDDKAVFDTTSNASLLTNLSISSGNLYRLKIEGEVTSGNLKLSGSSGLGNNEVISLPFEQDILHDGGGNTVEIRTIGSAEGFVTNVSVKEITDDTDLPRINYEGFSYQDSLGSELLTSGNDTSNIVGLADNQNINIQSSFLTLNKTYKITFEIYDYVEGSIFLLRPNNLGAGTAVSANGTYSYTVLANASISLIFRTDGLSTTLKLKNISVKEVLGQEVVPDSGCGSWLLEGQSTNLITQSELFSDASWSNTRITITTNTSETLNPSGGNNSELVTQSSTDTNGGAIYKFFSFSATSYTYSIFAKIKDVPFISISETTSAGGTLRRSWFDLQNGTLGSINSAHTAKIESYGNGWYRCSITFTATAGTYSILNYLSNGNNSTTAIVSTGLYIYGAQLEQQSYATSYIPTSGATNTRLQDIANNSGNSTLINSTEGVLYAEIAALSSPVDSPKNITISDGTVNNYVRIEYYQDGRVYGNVYDGTSVAANFVVNQLNFNKVAIQYSSSGSKLYVNGTGVDFASKIFTSNTLNTIQFSSAAADSNYFYGKNKALAVYKEALTDSNLRSLTYPNPVATTFDLDFDTIAEQFTFTRGSEATFVNAQGLIESTASNDAPRIDYSTGAKAFLLENQSTNLITQSELFSDASWGKQATIVDANSIISADGTQNASKIQSTQTGSALVSVSYPTLTVGNTYTFSCFAKKGNNDWIRLAHISSGGTGCWFDLENGVVGTVNSQSATIEDYGNGWYKCTNTFIATASTHANLVFIGICDADGSTNAGIVGQNDYLWGAQLEQQSYATSYIPTDGASATRNQELCNNATPVINSEEGTLYAEISALADDLSFRVVSISDGTNNNTIKLGYRSDTNAIYVEVKSASVGTAFLVYTTTSITDFHKIAFKYRLNDFSLWIDGVNVLNDSSGSVPVGLSQLSFNRGDVNNSFFGNTKGLKYYPKALADVQLEDLTTI